MGDAAETVNLVDQYGNAHAVPVNQVPAAIAQGLRPESAEHTAARLGGEALSETYGGVGGHATAATLGALRGLTFGGSDIVGSAIGEGENIQHYQQENPISSVAGEIIPQIAASFVAPESLLARTPAGLTARLGTSIAEAGEEGGVLARIGAKAAAGAVEGGLQQGGSYISDVALGNRDLSAEGFAGAMGKGALWGGVAGGALATTEEGLIAARRLFPAQEMTREAVGAAEGVARDEIGAAVEDGQQLKSAAQDRLRELRAQHAANDLETKVKLDAIAVRKSQELADAQVAEATAKAETAKVKLEAAKTGRKIRRAVQEEPGVSAIPETPGAPKQTWREFTAERMGEYMKTEGGHGPAMKRLSREWKEYNSAASAIAETAPQAEAVSAGVAEAPTSLERQLAAMKQGIDAGKSLSDLAGQRPTAIGLKSTHVEDALNAEIAKIDPQAQKLVQGIAEIDGAESALKDWLAKYQGGKVAGFERNQAARDYAEAMRPKDAGYYSRVPQGEGNALLPRGRESVFRGTEEERALADAKINMKVSPDERAKADLAIEEAIARRAGRKSVGEAVAEAKPEVPIDEQVKAAVRSKVSSIDDDVAKSAEAISRHEAASAELVDALGPAAPARAQAKAQAFREAQQTAEQATTDATARATANAEKAAETIKLGIPPEQPGALRRMVGKVMPGKGSGALQMLQDVGTGAEMLRMLGIDVPDPRNIPVIGPVLSAYLKARLLAKTFGRFGGKVPLTAETTIARKAAATKQRLMTALDKMTDVSAKAVGRAAKVAGGPTAALAHTLFDDGAPKSKAYTSEGPQSDVAEMYLARADEINRAMQPGAIDRAVRARVKTDDPTIQDAIVAAQERKLKFYDSKMPKPSEPPIPTQMHMPWVPSRAEALQWGRYIEAGEDPVAVIEAAADGKHVSPEAVETLKTVYPQLYQMAQARILDKAMDQSDPMPWWRRTQMSLLFDMPFDGSQTPQGAQFLQESYQPAPPAAPMQPQPMAPTVTADVRMGQRTDPTTKEI